MYQTKEFDKQGLHFIRLMDEASYVDICPERGGIVTAFYADGEDVLYMNEATLFDTSKNVRGGIPVLFPIAGQLVEKTYEWNGETYQLANHGLARTRPWRVIRQVNDEAHASIKISFHSTEETRLSYPFDFEVVLTYTLENGRLSIDQTVSNLSSDPMPIYPGYHPYFNITDKTLHLTSKATKYLDYNDQKVKPFTGVIDMNGLKESVVLLDGADTRIEFAFNTAKKVVFDQDARFRYTVLWVEGDQPFVCVEPWTATTNALNEAKKDLLLVNPGEPIELNVSIHLENR
ncbi:aldose epimerase [Sporolactobacillus laevolacticus]|uniref:aldose epimerase family protein n=1 Tax=Sporolactobacillus laevolacticus TaxID=33018 RepID=UPI0025B4571B|nr:aldose epimerase [Sporolactobacillus laevolacticus]MDN3956530.1 aldose epimerase [Sporolactobacillus laevolacticus]